MTSLNYTPDIEPADPNTVPTHFQVSANAWDCHAHVFGPILQFAFDPDRQYSPPEQTVNAYLGMLDTVGVKCGVLSQPSIYGFDNNCLIHALGASGGRLRGVVVADIMSLSEQQIEIMSLAGVCGLRMNLALPGGLVSETIESVALRLYEIGWHLEIVLDKLETLVELAPTLAKLKTQVVIEQMGSVRAPELVDGPGFLLLRSLLHDETVWCKLSHPYKISQLPPKYDDVVPYARALIEAAPSRLVWGSDWPHPRVPGRMPNDGFLLDLLWKWVDRDLTIANMVLSENPGRLYGNGRTT